ncbi:MAG: hypothetical protein HZY75_06270 [Nocardioidaceae bacterium]|nr:MAG: hypothetical protein HZY75_06270 [Nocardioidaceae bacterium]
MNRYGRLAMDHWQRWAPNRTAELPDPTEFFTDLGAQIQSQVSDLARLLAGPDRARETYMEKVARLQSAIRAAEEVVMAQLAWMPQPELTLAEAREEWEQTRPSEEALISWAERIQDCPDLMPSTAELEDKATEWALSPQFLTSLVEAEIPRKFLAENQPAMAEAATIRFLREVR